jgi:dual specificity phosphatase 12
MLISECSHVSATPVSGLFVGDFEGAQEAHFMPDITSVLCVARGCQDERRVGKDHKYFYAELLDDGIDELLPQIEECLFFIRSQIYRKESQGCLVHCMHGVSRSVAVCTAYLMKTEKINFSDAYEKIKETYPKAAISENFQVELERFGGEFKWNMRLDSQPHRMYWQNRKRVCKLDASAKIEAARLEAEMRVEAAEANVSALKARGASRYILMDAQCELDAAKAAASAANLEAEAATEATKTESSVKYDCRMCRHTLFHDAHIIQDMCVGTCSVYPVERMAWMDDVIADTSGKITCHKCKTKIGHYSWPGMKCPCGKWHAPAFFIQKVRVDNRTL